MRGRQAMLMLGGAFNGDRNGSGVVLSFDRYFFYLNDCRYFANVLKKVMQTQRQKLSSFSVTLPVTLTSTTGGDCGLCSIWKQFKKKSPRNERQARTSSGLETFRPCQSTNKITLTHSNEHSSTRCFHTLPLLCLFLLPFIHLFFYFWTRRTCTTL